MLLFHSWAIVIRDARKSRTRIRMATIVTAIRTVSFASVSILIAIIVSFFMLCSL